MKTSNKSLRISGLGVLFFVASLTGTAASQPTSSNRLVERVVAVVNTQVILESDLRRRMQQAADSAKTAKQTLPPQEVLRKQVLERLVNEQAILQRAASRGIEVDEATIQRAVERIAEQNGLSVTALRNQLEKEGVSFSRFRDDIRDEILISRVREREVDSRVNVAESEVDAFLVSQGQRLAQIDELLVSQILLPVASEASAPDKAAVKSKADAVLARIRGGEPFAVAARKESASADKEQGGSLGWRTTDRLPEIFVKALQGAGPGEIVGPIQSAGGWHILRLDDRRSQAQRPVVDVFRARHILIRVDGQTSEEAAARRLQELKRRMALGEAFGSLARSFSQDPGSAARGGELDWAYPGDLVPEFERAALQLRQGQVSDPVRTVFGFHIIEVLERKREPITEDRLRLFARMALRDRKLAEAVDEWTREVRANTYVDIKPDNP